MPPTGVSLNKAREFSLLAFVLLLSACGGGGSAATPALPDGGVSLHLQRIDVPLSLTFPLFLTAPPGDTNRLFVVEKGGVIKIVDRATNVLIGTFLDISNLVLSTDPERGLLGLAFDPLYAVNRRFYVSYTDTSGNCVVARYLADPANANLAQTTADRTIITVAHPVANHNGGMIAFGPDNLLYIGLGDGGTGGNSARNLGELLGKVLRIDVSQATAPQPPYLIPSTNPFVGQVGALGEIWSLGLRNPWRYSFDRQTGDLYIADVGQNTREEVNVSLMSAGSAGRGLDYGWNVLEGTLCYPPGTATCNTTGLTLPAVEYDHPAGCSITGGYVYRGAAVPALRGTYFYADFCAGFVRSFRFVNGQATEQTDWVALRPGGNITSFGEDAAGELYIMTSQGGLYRIVPN